MLTLAIRPLLYAAPFVLLAALVEGCVLARRAGEHYDWRAAGISLLDMLGRQVVHLLPLSLAAPVFAFAWRHRIATVRLDGVAALALLFIGTEFCYYGYHRAAHRVRWFWATHAVHHSPEQLNLSAAYRLGWTGALTGTTVFFTPLVWLGFRPQWVLTAFAFDLLYQFWLHATWIPRLGWLEYVLNTPSAHRVHHASNPRYLDANFGGVLIVFDRLFGTYVAESPDEPCRYGLVHPIPGHNLWRVEFSTWAGLLKDAWQARSVREWFGQVFGPPGWRANELARAARSPATKP